jgi:hypothetical protein
MTHTPWTRAAARDAGKQRWCWVNAPARQGGAYVWSCVEVRAAGPGHGRGVYATRALPAGLLLPYGGAPLRRQRLSVLAKRDQDNYVAFAADGAIDANPCLLPAGHSDAWVGSLVNEASPGQLYNCRLVWWGEAQSDTADAPVYPHAPRWTHALFIELMVNVPAGGELLTSYHYTGARARRYAIAPPPPLSTPPQWGQHLAPDDARALQRERVRALAAAAAAETRSAALKRLAAVRRTVVAAERATLMQLNAGRWRENKARAAARAAAMRVAKRARHAV